MAESTGEPPGEPESARGAGHIVVRGGVSLWRSLMRLDLVSSTASSNGIVELQYRRNR
jgi:hypothetical protein